ncbi:class-II aminoacyl-tRNA synthetase family protein [Nocardiopsis halotolerans]|uniref:hypothetical protein n=1 Tax=Nocardiopsis halotolerans TaxID=124252 RepID=UPI000378D946|nr:hypothetical protein [Nocardiopsis halotolerans]
MTDDSTTLGRQGWRNGLFTLSGKQTSVLDRVDAAVLGWAHELGAVAERHAELFTAEQLERVGYFDSFPHLAHRVRPWMAGDGTEEDLVLTSASCYGVYFSRSGGAVEDRTVLTVRQTCRRREDEYVPLRRQREFQMREVVFLGTEATVEALLGEGLEAVRRIAEEFGVPGSFKAATDPFFRRDDPRLLHQKLFPTKQEFVDVSGLAVASVNSHRNFFGERCGMRLSDGTPAFTGCVAFGLERWVDAVLRADDSSDGLGERV